MSHGIFPHVPLRLFHHCLPPVSRIAIAAVLFGFTAVLTPAEAIEHDIRENDSGLFNVPGEGSPYVDRLHPRIGWPPMPERRPYGYLHHAGEDGPDYHDAPPVPHNPIYEGGPIEEHGPVQEHGPDHGRGRDYAREEHGPGHGQGPDYAREEHGPGHGQDRNYAREDRRDIGDDDVTDEDGLNEPYPVHGFGRMFPKAAPESSAAYPALHRLGPAMVEQGDPEDPSGDAETPAGYTYLGQFIDHDLTLDTTTDLGKPIKGDYQLENARTPELDLDNVYGGGPSRSPYLYRLPYLRVGHLISGEGGPPRFDLFRTRASHDEGPTGGDPIALLGDPRDDENIIISQLHAAFIAFHNRTTDILIERDYGRDRYRFCHQDHCNTQELADKLPDDVKVKIFQTARDHVTHYYHRLIVEDFLPRLIGQQHTANLLQKGRDFFLADGLRGEDGQVREAFIPVEFAVAAYRFGHSQVRESYTLHDGVKVRLLTDGRNGDPRAFQPVTPHLLADWRYFFDIGPEQPYGFNFVRRIDPELAPSLHRLARARAVGGQDVTSLAARNLARGKTQHLPSGQEVARIVLPALEARGLLGNGYGHGGHGGVWQSFLLPPDDRTRHFLGGAETPLWYYVLQEASVFGSPTHLHAQPNGHDGYIGASNDFPRYGRDRYLRRVSDEGSYGPHKRGGYDDGPDGGHRLGPVGAAIVGEVLTGLIEHFRVKTGKGLDYHPLIKGSVSSFGGAGGKYGSGHRYLMRNFLIDAGVVGGY